MAKIVAVAVLVLFLAFTVPENGQAFRCGRGLVNLGDSSGRVLIECGRPTSKEVVGTKTKGKSKKKVSLSEKRTFSESTQRTERWFYNCGENDFIYVLTFEGGKLAKEQTEGYGRGQSDCQGRR